MIAEPERVLNFIAQLLYDKKGFNILALDIRELSSLTDYFLIAEGNVDKHTVALAKEVIARLKELGLSPTYVEGMREGDWIVIDYLELVGHLFKPGFREKYRLEELWSEGHIIDLVFG